MMKDEALAHNEQQVGTGVLLIQLGTPAAPTPAAVRRYLGEFLWDRRVVDLPRPLWWLILHGAILRLRPARSARLYEKIWMDEGAPLLVHSRRLATGLSLELRRRLITDAPAVALGMRYGEPSIRQALESLRRRGCRRLLVLPLYPQYCASTTASALDAVVEVLRDWRAIPELRLVTHYHDEAGYLAALAATVQQVWEARGEPHHLVVSFHGQPWRHVQAGDPYHLHCRETAEHLADRLALAPDRWTLAFQSRFGREPWLEPYTVDVLKRCGADSTRRIDVICPGFAADCLETLEEINFTGRDIFMRAGGECFHYIPALNDRPDHVTALAGLVQRHLLGWERDEE